MTNIAPHHNDHLRLVWLFEKPYYWDTEDGRLVLKRALWETAAADAASSAPEGRR